jgi:hypothetical protein
MKAVCSLAEARGHSEERSRIRTAADAIEGQPPNLWVKGPRQQVIAKFADNSHFDKR